MNFGNAFKTGQHRRNVYLAVNDLYCGCGCPAEGLKLIHELLKAAPFYENRERLLQLLPTDGLEMLVLGALDNAELIEHGGSIAGSWLTPRGEEALAGLDVIALAEGYEAYEDQMRCVHGFDVEDTSHDCMAFDKEEAA